MSPEHPSLLIIRPHSLISGVLGLPKATLEEDWAAGLATYTNFLQRPSLPVSKMAPGARIVHRQVNVVSVPLLSSLGPPPRPFKSPCLLKQVTENYP